MGEKMMNQRMTIRLRHATARQDGWWVSDTAIVGLDAVVVGAAREDTRPTSDGFNAK